MSAPQVSIVMAAQDAQDWIEASVGSALGQAGVRLEVVVVDDGSRDRTLPLLRSLRCDRLRVFHNDTPRGASEARRQGLEAARGEWVTFLESGCLLAPDACQRALQGALSAGLDLAAAAADGRPAGVVPDGSVVHAVFSQDRAPLRLAGVFARRSLARRALEALPHRPVGRDSELVALFSLCYEAPGLWLTEKPLVTPGAPAAPEPWSLRGFQLRCLSSQAAAAVGRLISQNNDWDCHRQDYEALVCRLLEPLLAVFPGGVPTEERAQAFECLARSWPAPELLAGIARWRHDTLLPVAEAASGQGSPEAFVEGRVERVALLWPQSQADPDHLRAQVQAIELLGAEPSLLLDQGMLELGAGEKDGAELADPCRCLRLPAWTPGLSYLERAQALVRALQRCDADVVAAPLTSSVTQALDLLCVRAAGVPVVLFAPQGVAGMLGAGSPGHANRLVTVAQNADVLGVPSPKSMLFWATAAPGARVVPLDGADEPLEEYWSRLFDALEATEPERLPVYRPSVFSSSVASLARAMSAQEGRAPLPAQSAEERVRQLEEQTALLQARLAAAQDEARELRSRLAELGEWPQTPAATHRG